MILRKFGIQAAPALAACCFISTIAFAGNDPDSGRVDPALGSRVPVSAHAKALAASGRIVVHVYTDPSQRVGIAGAVRAMRTPRVLRSSLVAGDGFLVLETTPAGARRIAALPGVRWVEQAPEPSTRNDTLRLIVQTGTLSAGAPFDAAGLTGVGQIVGVIDQPLDWSHCAFDDSNPIGPTHRKIEAYNAPFAGVSTHGTHVCGILLGDSIANSDLRGVATGARLVFDTIPAFDETTFYEQLMLHASQGATIHSNSWGDEQSVAYGGLARAIDAFCWENDEQLVVVAVSNQAVLKTPENAKNALAVAATLDSPFQDRVCVGAIGPTPDGRRKPDLVAPGCSIFSAYPFGAGCPTAFASGTSMATPAIAGAAAIVRQYFMQGWYPTGEPSAQDAFTPSGALLKSVLIAGAADVTDEPGWPSAREGFGRVDLSGSLPIGPGSSSRLIAKQRWNNDTGPQPALSTGGEHRVLFTVENASVPVRIVLAWHDAPGEFGTADPVINDLDLEVIGPGGVVYLGNDIDETAGASIADSSGAPDMRNTVEVVSLPAPLPGAYTVRIIGSVVSVGTQGYGLAVTGGVAEVLPAACSPADLAEPLGALDLSDITAFLTGFGSQSTVSDLNGDGLFDLSDINMFVSAFSGGCG